MVMLLPIWSATIDAPLPVVLTLISGVLDEEDEEDEDDDDEEEDDDDELEPPLKLPPPPPPPPPHPASTRHTIPATGEAFNRR